MQKQFSRKMVSSLVLFLSIALGWANLQAQQSQAAPGAETPQSAPDNGPGQGQRGPRRGGFMMGGGIGGTVSSIGVDRFEVKKMDGTTQVVMVNDQTHYRQGQQDIALEDLKAGDRVMVRGQANDNKEFVASAVRRVTEEEAQRMQAMMSGDRAGGEITAIGDGQITVHNQRQGDKVILVNDQTTFMKQGQAITLKDLKVGDRVFAAGTEANGKFTATRVMTGQFRRGPGGGGRPPASPNQ